MAVPAFDAAGAYLTGTSATTGAVAVPAGAAAGKVAIIHLYIENTDTITWPSGFAACTNSPVVVTGAKAHNHHIAWKRLSGADSGTYAVSWTTSAWREAVATLYSGCAASGTPLEVLGFASNTTDTTTTAAVSGTTGGPDRLLVWSGTNWNEGAWTAPSGYTKRSGEPATAALACATLAQPTQGTTGSVTGTCSVASASAGFLVGLFPDAPAGLPRVPVMPRGASTRASSW